MNSSDLLSSGSNSRKRYTLRLLLKFLGGDSLHIGGTYQPLPPPPLLLPPRFPYMGYFYKFWKILWLKLKCKAYFFTKILQNSATFSQKLTPGFKNHMRNWGSFRQAVRSPKRWNLIGYFCPKKTFLKLKPYTQMTYLISFSTTCVKIPQISETISHFSQRNSSVFF